MNFAGTCLVYSLTKMDEVLKKGNAYSAAGWLTNVLKMSPKKGTGDDQNKYCDDPAISHFRSNTNKY